MTHHTQSAQKLHTESVFNALSDLQWRFVTAMVENPDFSKKDACELIGIRPDTAYRWDKRVDEAIEQARANVHNAALERRKQAVLKAIAVKIKLLDSKDENIRSRVASEIIEWELGKASQRTEIANADGNAFEVSGHIQHGVDDASQILSELKSLGVFDDKDIGKPDNA